MRAALIKVFLFVPFFSFSQQLKFKDILEVGNDYVKFEKKMYELGNDVIKYRTSDSIYSYETFSGAIGAGKKVPTGNKSLEQKYLLFDSLTLTESNLYKQYTDEQVNQFFKSGALKYAEGPHNDYNYVSGLKGYTVSLWKSATFAEDFIKDTKKGRTFYYLETNIITRSINLKRSNYFSLSISYASPDDYKFMIMSIQENAKYIETTGYENEITIHYQLSDIKRNKVLKISCSPNKDSSGGSINFNWESK